MFETLMWVTLGGVVGFIWGLLAGCWCQRPEEYHWVAVRKENGKPGLILIRGDRHD